MHIKNKTVFCLLIITLFTCFFFARSVDVRERWIVPTFLTKHYPALGVPPVLGGAGAAQQLVFANNWLHEGAFNLRFLTYMYPKSVETPTLDKRKFYGSFAPGAYIPIYMLLKALDITGIVPDIYNKRGTQLLLFICYNYTLHFLMVLLLGGMVFFVCRKVGFDNLNSTLLAIVPAVIQFHNSGSLYYHHIEFFHVIAVMLPFVAFIFCELLRFSGSPHALRAVQIIQPIIMFYGVLTDWFFVFIAITIYIMRVVRKEIDLPRSLLQAIHWIKQSFLFFAPSLLAIACWGFTLIYYLQNIAQTTVSSTSISSRDLTLVENILYRTGLSHGINYIFHYWKTSLVTYPYISYGLTGLIMIYSVFYMVTRGRKFMSDEARTNNIVVIAYLMFFIPCLTYMLVLSQVNADHAHISILFSPALSVSFAFVPILVLQILKKSHLISALKFKHNQSITAVALVALVASTLYGYGQIYDKQNVTKLFSAPAYQHAAIGNFIKKNATHKDVVFSNYYYIKEIFDLNELYFANKLIHFANNLDHVYFRTKKIKQDFNIKVFFYILNNTEAEMLTSFLKDQGIFVGNTREDKLGQLLDFNGKQFNAWYERVHECDVYPKRCNQQYLIGM